MLTELGGKGGRICQPALDGALRCPLIVRPTSEDVVTGNLFGALAAINPRRWLPQLLNRALGAERFRTQAYRSFRIELWQRQPAMPSHLIPWEEGSTEVDVVISWENPATTIFLEMKYRSDLSATTSRNEGSHGFPADQLIRNARVGLYRCGWYREPRLFELPPRDFVLLLVNVDGSHPLVDVYRDPEQLRRSIPNSRLLSQLPGAPFIGCLGYRAIGDILQAQRPRLTWSERVLADRIADYLPFKLKLAAADDGSQRVRPPSLG